MERERTWKKTTPNTRSWDFGEAEHWQHLLDFYKAEHCCGAHEKPQHTVTKLCSSTGAALPLCPGCTNTIFHPPKHGSCGEPHQHLHLGGGCGHVLPVLISTPPFLLLKPSFIQQSMASKAGALPRGGLLPCRVNSFHLLSLPRRARKSRRNFPGKSSPRNFQATIFRQPLSLKPFFP